MPVAESDLAIVAAARNAYRAALLLSPADFVRESIGDTDVIELRRRLVVPGTPGFAAVHADNSTLVGNQKNNVRLIWIDPQILIIISAGRTTQTRPRCSAIRGPHRNNAGAVNHVRILGID